MRSRITYHRGDISELSVERWLCVVAQPTLHRRSTNIGWPTLDNDRHSAGHSTDARPTAVNRHSGPRPTLGRRSTATAHRCRLYDTWPKSSKKASVEHVTSDSVSAAMWTIWTVGKSSAVKLKIGVSTVSAAIAPQHPPVAMRVQSSCTYRIQEEFRCIIIVVNRHCWARAHCTLFFFSLSSALVNWYTEALDRESVFIHSQVLYYTRPASIKKW